MCIRVWFCVFSDTQLARLEPTRPQTSFLVKSSHQRSLNGNTSIINTKSIFLMHMKSGGSVIILVNPIPTQFNRVVKNGIGDWSGWPNLRLCVFGMAVGPPQPHIHLEKFQVSASASGIPTACPDPPNTNPNTRYPDPNEETQFTSRENLVSNVL